MTMTADPDEEDIPLLNSGTEQARKQSPFPWFQFSILFAVQTAEYLPLNTIYPFLPDLIRHIGIAKEEKDVGFYVGSLTSTFYAAEVATTFCFARLSDDVGRKFVFLACALGLSIFVNSFGLSTTFWALVPCEAVIGAFTGTRGVATSMLAEMTDSTDVARAIAYFDMSWLLAGAIGSKIGGSLSRPGDQLAQLFGSIEFFKKYPYYLPCGICSILCLASFLVGTMFLKETKHKRSPSLRTVFVPSAMIVATNITAMYMVEKFFWATEALFLSTPIRDGGLGLSPRAIGTFSSLSSILIGVSQLFVFSRLHDGWGSRNMCIVGGAATVPRFILWPVMNWIARRDGYSGLLWFALGCQAFCSVWAQFSRLAIWVLIIQASGSSASVAGFCQTGASVASALAPAISSWLFSLSMGGGYMVYFVFVCSAVLALGATLLLPKVG